MEQPARRRFYKIAKGLLHSEIAVQQPFFYARPVCYSGLLLTREML